MSALDPGEYRREEQLELADVAVAVGFFLVGDSDHRDDASGEDDRHGGEARDRDVARRIPLLERVGNGEIVVHDGGAPPDRLSPETGLGKAVDGAAVEDRAMFHHEAGPRIEGEFGAGLVVEVDVAVAAPGQLHRLGEGEVQEVLVVLGIVLEDADEALEPELVGTELLLDAPDLGDVEEERGEAPGTDGEGADVVAPSEGRRIFLETLGDAAQGDPPVALDPRRLRGGQQLPDGAPDDRVPVQSGQLGEGGVDLQEAVVPGNSRVVEDQLVEGEGLAHPVEDREIKRER